MVAVQYLTVFKLLQQTRPNRVIGKPLTKQLKELGRSLVATNLRYNHVVHPAMQLFAKALIKEITDLTKSVPSKAIFVSRQAWKTKNPINASF